MFIARRRRESQGEGALPERPAHAAPTIAVSGGRGGEDERASSVGRSNAGRSSEFSGRASANGGRDGDAGLARREDGARSREGGASTANRIGGRSGSFSRARAKEDTLGKLLEKMCATEEEDSGDGASALSGSGALRDRVETEARSANPAEFLKFRNAVHDRVGVMITGEDVGRKIGGLRAIDQLIEIEFGEEVEKVKKFADYLLSVMSTSSDESPQMSMMHDADHPVSIHDPLWSGARAHDLVRMTSAVLGRLVLHSGALTTEIVDAHVQRAIELLRAKGDNRKVTGMKRYAASLNLVQLARNAPTIFNVHVPIFVASIWSALRDPSLEVREAAIVALHECLLVTKRRETRYRVQWYYALYEECRAGLKQNAAVEEMHGSLLVFGELLGHTGEFMLSRYREVARTILRLQDVNVSIIKTTIVGLIPKLAVFSPKRFAESYLVESCALILTTIRSSTDSAAGFLALSELADSMSSVMNLGGAEDDHSNGGTMLRYLPEVSAVMYDLFTSRARGPHACPEALECAGALMNSLQGAWKPHFMNLMKPMFAGGLSESLVIGLESAIKGAPDLMPAIQLQLAETIANELYRAPEQDDRCPILPNKKTVQVALRTMRTFPFEPAVLLQSIRKNAIVYLDALSTDSRIEAALTCCSAMRLRVGASRGAANAVEHIMEALIPVAVGDSDKTIRTALLTEFCRPSASIDSYLSQSKSLRSLFLTLNDESVDIRMLGVELLGRLATRNPAYVLPALRSHMLQLLSELEYSSETMQREESSKVMAVLIRSCPRLVAPYLSPIMRCLTSILRQEESSGTKGSGSRDGMKSASMSTVSKSVGAGSKASASAKRNDITGREKSAVLMTIGELANVSGYEIKPFVQELLALLLVALKSASTRDCAVVTLGKIIESSGYVAEPFTTHPQLLPQLLRMLGNERDIVRSEVLRTLGILGALDPHAHRGNKIRSHGEGVLSEEGVRGIRQARLSMKPADRVKSGNDEDDYGNNDADDDELDILPTLHLTSLSDDYYPTIALNSLLRVLRDPSRTSHRHMAVCSIVYIFQVLDTECVQYLPNVIPVMLSVIRTADDALREAMFKELASLVSVIKAHIRRYLSDILDLMHLSWEKNGITKNTLLLCEELSMSLNDEFRVNVPTIIPRIVSALTEAERLRRYDTVPCILHALEMFGTSLNDHLYLLLPTLVRLFKPSVLSVPDEVKRSTLQSLQRMIPRMRLADQASVLIHSLTRMLEDEDIELRIDTVHVLTTLEVALGRDYAIFLPVVKRAVSRCGIFDPAFHEMVTRVESGNPLLYREDDIEQSLTASPLKQKKPEIEKRLSVNQLAIRRAWESSQRSTKEDWLEWMRRLALDLLKSSPLPSLRACSELAQVQPGLARDLFCAAFVSCWAQLNESHREILVRSLEAALGSPTIPPEIVSVLLNLCEFMEHDERPIPVDVRTLGMIAQRSRAYAKALHYKELEFITNPGSCVAALIAINNQLQLPEAARGVLVYAQDNLKVEIKESWYEKLEQWDDALEAYRRKLDELMHVDSTQATEDRREAMVGQLRCLAALAEWEEIQTIFEAGNRASVDWDEYRNDVTTIAAKAAWHLGDWDQMEKCTDQLERDLHLRGRLPNADRVDAFGKYKSSVVNSTDCDFYKAILAIRRGSQDEARVHLAAAREVLGTELAALVGESYDRSYNALIRAQQLAELDEVIEYSQLASIASAAASRRQQTIRKMWRDRIFIVKRDVEVWQSLLQVRSLVLPMSEETEIWLKFAALNRKQGRERQSRRTLLRLLEYDPIMCADGTAGFGAGSGRPVVMFAFIKHLWQTGQKRQAFMRLQSLANELRVQWETDRASGQAQPKEQTKILSRAFLKLGKWRWTLAEGMDEEALTDVLMSFRTATTADEQWAKAWHHWALFNATAMEHFKRQDGTMSADAMRHVAPAISGFFRSIALSGSSVRAKGGSLQDILRLLTLWFNHGGSPEVETALIEGFGHVNIDTWLAVIPQIVARIHTQVLPVRDLIYQLLVRVGRQHPQAVLYPLLVACKSQSASRQAAAHAILDNVRLHSALLVEQAQIVSLELIRVAIVWHEAWHEALEEASRLYFGEQNVDGMMSILTPLHHILERQGAETLQEMGFVQNYGRELQEAHDLCQKYQKSKREEELNQAWDLYYHVFKRITKQLPTMTTLELRYVSPRLLNSRDLELCVPGNYIPGQVEQAKIRAFAPTMHVITSKQRPRRLQIHGSDGKDYGYLLKGHEDLRQDERVMQLFGLVNTLLNSNMTTAHRDLGIARYAVVPLSPNSGLIGWVPNCDTLHALIREYRDAHKIPLNLEHRMMLAMTPDYDHLPLVNKVEIFQHAVENTSGGDLTRVLWLKSRSSEQWLERRTAYTRSLAVMSMVGYLLGLGDRHPSNLMVDRYSGKVLHIDFGDCFEASMYREKFPEKVPFRLTRMLVHAMGVSGIEGNFRNTCESVVTVLRNNKDSVMAMLEAFVHDPLINWRLLTHNVPAAEDDSMTNSSMEPQSTDTPTPDNSRAPSAGTDHDTTPPPGKTQRQSRPPSVGVVETPSGPVPSSSSVIGLEATHAMAVMSSSINDTAVPTSLILRRTELINAMEAYGTEDGQNDALNERAVSVMQRMSAKLTGRDGDLHHSDTMMSDSVEMQVERLITEATSAENLSVSYVGWCPWW